VARDSSDDTLARLQAAQGDLAGVALARLEAQAPWYTQLSPRDRSAVGLVAQAGIAAFVSWYRSPDDRQQASGVTSEVFGSAPRGLARVVSLHQTLQIVRTVVEAVEDHVPDVAAPEHRTGLREAVLRYSREVAFGAAEVYARAAEQRGAWDARLEALVVDALVRGEAHESLSGRVTALGWHREQDVVVVAGERHAGPPEQAIAQMRRAARQVADDALVGLQGDRVLVVLGSADPRASAAALAEHFGPGPVVVGSEVPGLAHASRSARTALAGLTAVRAWPGAPRPVAADDLLPERVLTGDATARRALADRVHAPLTAPGPALLETVRAYLEHGRALEATARALFVHPNTVRYRLRRVTRLTGWDPTVPRDAFVIQVALAVGALAERSTAREAVARAAPTG
jgi:DNA-binding PucR family transcriptional regulator